VVVLGLVLGLPYLHKPPEIRQPLAIQAVLIEQAVVPQPPVVVEQPPVELPPPPPVPEEEIELPEPVREPPKIALPKPPEKKPVPPKPQQLLKPTVNTAAVEAEIKARELETKKTELARMLNQELQTSATTMKVSANQAMVDRYAGLIRDTVARRWNRPLSARNGMMTVLRITILPGGEVANVVTVRSSGDRAFDASAEEAARKGPLPVPEDLAVFNQSFRNFTMEFTPKDL
jgi:colicin import membrane protein